MLQIKSGRTRRLRRSFQQRIWLANLLSLGAGVSISMMGGGVNADQPTMLPTNVDAAGSSFRMNPFVAASQAVTIHRIGAMGATGEIVQTSDLQMSSMRLKTIGTAVGLVPIGSPRSTGPVLSITHPNSGTVRVNPMASRCADGLEHPVIEIEEVTFSFSDLDQKSDPDAASVTQLLIPEPAASDLADQPVHAAAKPDVIDLSENEQDIALMPWLPAPNQAWIDPTPTSNPASSASPARRYPDQCRAAVDVVTPPMMSFEAKIPARFAAFARPVAEAQRSDAPLKTVEVESVGRPSSTQPTSSAPVSESVSKSASRPSPAEQIARVSERIRSEYPGSSVTVFESKRKLIVRGVCRTQENATEIIRLVRGEFLIPVDDQIVIR